MATPSLPLVRGTVHRCTVYLLSALVLLAGLGAVAHHHEHEHDADHGDEVCATCVFLAQGDHVAPTFPAPVPGRVLGGSLGLAPSAWVVARAAIPYLSRAPPVAS